jgi:hypothetical protein
MDPIAAWLTALEHSALAVFVAQSTWAFPTAETVHVIALTLTIGTVLVVDLRLIGLASRRQPFTHLQREVLPWTWAAFVLAVVSGGLMFISQASAYAANTAFRLKVALLLLAGLNMLVFELGIARGAAAWDRGARVPWPATCAGAASIALWVAIVFFGRRIGFTMGPN